MEDQPLITLQLDNRLILDSSLGLLAQEVSLVKGFYQVSLLYRSPSSTSCNPTRDATGSSESRVERLAIPRNASAASARAIPGEAVPEQDDEPGAGDAEQQRHLRRPER